MKFITAALAAAFLLPTVALAGEPVRAFMGTRTVVKEQHMVPQLGSDEGYGEKYTFNADFPGESSFYFSLTISNLGMGDHNMEAKGRLTVGDQKFTWNKKLDDDEWKHAKSPFSITAGPATLEGQPEKLVMKAKSGANELEFEFTPIARAWRPKNGQIQFGKDRNISDFTVFPLMKVTGRYKMGGEWTPIEGTGFGSHTWSDTAVYEQSRSSREFRAIQGEYTVYMREVIPAEKFDGTPVRYVLVTKGAEILIESYTVETAATASLTDSKHENKYVVPESFTLQGFDDEDKARQFRGSVTKVKQLTRKDLLTDMNAAVKMVASRYSKPVRYDYEVGYHFEVKTPTGVETIKGDNGRYEVYHWNK